MKRIILLIVVLIFILSMSSIALASGDWRFLESKYTREAPEEFYINPFTPHNTEDIQEKFQNNMEFFFINGESIDEEIVITEGTTDDYKEYKLIFHLTYTKKDLKNYDDVFISGTFDYIESNTDTLLENFTGDVIGQIVLINPVSHNFIGFESDDVGALVLRLNAPKEDFSINFYLNPSGTGLLMTDPEFESSNDNFEHYDYSHESRPHIPKPSNQTDVAVGVGLSTVGIAVVNAFSGTSVFGNASFNGSFNPTSPPAPSAPATGAAQSASGGSGGVIGVVKDFFKGLFANLREMLTDEGRSFAGGKLAETLEDIIPDDIEKE